MRFHFQFQAPLGSGILQCSKCRGSWKPGQRTCHLGGVGTKKAKCLEEWRPNHASAACSRTNEKARTLEAQHGLLSEMMIDDRSYTACDHLWGTQTSNVCASCLLPYNALDFRINLAPSTAFFLDTRVLRVVILSFSEPTLSPPVFLIIPVLFLFIE
jgi:hypothetical protein